MTRDTIESAWPDYFPALRELAERYFAVWPLEREAILNRRRREEQALSKKLGVSVQEIADRLGEDLTDAELTTAVGELQTRFTPEERARGQDLHSWLIIGIPRYYGGLLAGALTIGHVEIFSPREVLTIAGTGEDLRAYPPVAVGADLMALTLRDMRPISREEMPAGEVRDRFDELTAMMEKHGGAPASVGVEGPKVRAAYRAFAGVFYPWAIGQVPLDAISSPPQYLLPRKLPQPTFQEVKRMARGLALAPDGIGWRELLGGFALIHEENGAEHNLRLEGSLIPQWWGRPSDNASLRSELATTGHDGIALLYNAIGLILQSDEGHVDVDIDELISRVGMDPRSKAERAQARLKVWRILTILAATRVIGARRKVIRDRVSGKTVRVESDDSLLGVSAWRAVGTQVAFDVGVAPLTVTMTSSPWLARWRGNRAALQDFGNLLAISEIPIGRPSGAWARAIGWALQQLWREQATRATFGRAGDGHRHTARFRPFTRRELLDLFPPRPSVHDVLDGNDPRRAIDYWEAAIAELRAKPEGRNPRGDPPRQPIVGHYGPTRDWKRSRPRKGWAELWLDEALDIRPASEAARVLGAIARTEQAKRRGNSKLRESAGEG